MQSKILFVEAQVLKNESRIELNTDDKTLRTLILDSQNIELKQVLGDDVYKLVENEIVSVNQIAGYVISDSYKELIKDKIQPYLIACVVCDFIVVNNYKLTNKGNIKLNDNSGSNISSDEVEYFKNYYDQRKNAYKKILVDYLKSNDLINCNSTDTNITGDLGWFLPTGNSYSGIAKGNNSDFVGRQGSQGFQGFQGEKGERGEQGFQGFIGSQGDRGFQGLKGDRGFQGYQGEKGDVGERGFQGLVGVQGLRGFQGFQGFQGATGTQGFQGDRGFQGFQGVSAITNLNTTSIWGEITSSTGTGATATSISRSNATDGNEISTTFGFNPFLTTTGATNFPVAVGGGFRFIRSASTALGSMAFWTGNSGSVDIWYKTGLTVGTWNNWARISSKEWTNDNFVSNVLNAGTATTTSYTGSVDSINTTSMGYGASLTGAPNSTGFISNIVFGGGASQTFINQSSSDAYYYRVRSGGVWGSWFRHASQDWVSNNTLLLGGNTTGAAITLGTKDNNTINFVTNNTNRATITSSGNVTVTSGDLIIVSSAKGLVLKSSNGTQYRLVVSDAGVLSTVLV